MAVAHQQTGQEEEQCTKASCLVSLAFCPPFFFFFFFIFVFDECTWVDGNECVSECLYNAILVHRLDCGEHCLGADQKCPR